MSWSCEVCNAFVTVFLASLLFHIRTKHGSDANLLIKCCVNCCPQTFTKADSFYRHVKRRHGVILQSEESKHTALHNNEAYESPLESSEEPSESNEFSDEQPQQEWDHAKKKAAAYILHLKSECRLTQKATEKVIEATQALQSDTLHSLKRKLKDSFKEKGAQFNLTDIDALFNTDNQFDGLSDEYSFMEYMKKRLNYVEPVKKVLGKRTVITGRGDKRRIQEQEDTFYYVPVIETIQKLMCNNRFREEISKKHQTTSEKSQDYCDGMQAKHNRFLQLHPNAFQIILYYDDVELCNPLGSKSKIHKVGLFYYTFANIHPKYRSRLCGINLLCICLSRHLTSENYGINLVLHPLVHEMLALERGVEIVVNEHSVMVHGIVIALAADTLAAHFLGGFKEGVGFSYRKCRHCMISSEDISTLFKASEFVQRETTGHAEMCEKIEMAESSELRETFSTAYGVNKRSVLEELPFFSVVENIPQDLMHVILEGCLPYTLKQVLKYYIKTTSTFTLEQLNGRVKSYEFGHVDVANRPTLIQNNALEEDGHIRQSSSQMWTLGRFLPVLIGNLINLDDQVWQCYLLLLQIMSISFSPICQKEDLITLQGLVEYYLTTFKQCFDTSIIPKQHYLCHLAEQMSQFGPLIRFWCMRFEAKHAYFKSLCSSASFKNITYYMAKRHQLSAANYLLDIYDNGMDYKAFRNEILWGPSTVVTDYEYAVNELSHFITLTEETSVQIYQCRWVTLNGNKFKPDSFFVICFENGMPVFAQVKSIWSVDGIPLVWAAAFSTIEFSENLNVFEIEPPGEDAALQMVNLHTLTVPEVYCSYIMVGQDDTLYIVPKTDLRMYAVYDN